MQHFPIGIQSFNVIRDENLLYVDKTELIHKLVTIGKYYFLARPRRFGKSLLLSTLAFLFKGEKRLYKDLWIIDQWNWDIKHPVIHLSFNLLDYQGKGIEQALLDSLAEQADLYQIRLTENTIKSRFRELLTKLALQNEVVVLIDEYDKPIIDYLEQHEREKAVHHQQVLKSFYSVIKDSDNLIRFLLITGVSKFSKVGVFSDLNNLRDITFSKHFSALCGYTEHELHHYFEQYLPQIETPTNLWPKIKQWYNGYSWDAQTFVYNPFSILSYFADEEFRNYWFSTGTPTFLINMLKERFFYDFDERKVDISAFESYGIENLESIPLLFQTGYLTIKKIDRTFNMYTLGYPNKEVKDSMLRYLIKAFSHGKATDFPIITQLNDAIIQSNFKQLIQIINNLFKSIPYQIFIAKKEAYYHSLIYLVFKYLGQFIKAEVCTVDGRLDAIIETDRQVLIMEFKLDQSAIKAIEQIKMKGYADAFRQEGKALIGLGINFDSETKQVSDWKQVSL